MSQNEKLEAETEVADESVDEPVDEHLEDVEDGCGCTEIWEHLSENREATSD